MKLTLKRNSKPRWWVQIAWHKEPWGGLSYLTVEQAVYRICYPHKIKYRVMVKPHADFACFYKKADAALFMLKAGNSIYETKI